LIGLLGGDRLSSRNEIHKLTLYARGKTSIELSDVNAAVADASEIALDGIIDAAFAGRTGEVDNEFSKARASGSSPAAIIPVGIIPVAIGHVASLHKMMLVIEGGDTIEFAMKRAAPPVHFTRESKVGEALRAWTPPRLLRAMDQLAEASLDIRRSAHLADVI